MFIDHKLLKELDWYMPDASWDTTVIGLKDGKKVGIFIMSSGNTYILCMEREKTVDVGERHYDEVPCNKKEVLKEIVFKASSDRRARLEKAKMEQDRVIVEEFHNKFK
jgi:hypothetical protein